MFKTTSCRAAETLSRVRPTTIYLAAAALSLMTTVETSTAQPLDRVQFNGQNLFLSGGNVAWVNFARDIGPGTTDLARFGEMFGQLSASGGNAMRLWLHTDGAVTPEYTGDLVSGPGAGAIEDLTAILDRAWENQIGLMLCLWSHDMLRTSNSATMNRRNRLMLTDQTALQAYVDYALVPLVEGVKDHPAIIAWEVFNEPEGISDEHGWSGWEHVPMTDIQRVVNVVAGAVHRTDPSAQVTNGSWAFIASSDVTPAGPALKTAEQLAPDDVERIRTSLSSRYRYAFSLGDTRAMYESVHAAANYNYYRDDRLIAEGGDSDGTLDFYTVHYYDWAGTALSPFHQDAQVWGLTKPVAIAEFFMEDTYGVAWQDLYTTLYDRGYAGGLAWQWYNYPIGAEGVVNWPRILQSTAEMYSLHPEDVAIYVGLRIAYFRANPEGVESGQSSELSWFVAGAETVTLDGVPVDSVGSRTVSPAVTTTYTLEATGRGTGEVINQDLIVTVLEPGEVNRALGRDAFASTIERCCGGEQVPGLAVDGDPATRWSSAWDATEADENPDDEWIYVDLGSSMDIDRVVLRWEVACGSSYDVDVSFDARLWATVFEERSGDCETDEITFSSPPVGRYVRMHGLDRATQWGFSLWEIEVYGLPSSMQPPDAAISAPHEGAVVTPGEDLVLTVDASDPDGEVTKVDFFVDGNLVGSATAAPYTMTWPAPPEGEHVVSAVAVDDDGLAYSTEPYPVFITDTSSFVIYEAEDSSYEGDINRDDFIAGASGGAYLFMREASTMTFGDVLVPQAGEYLVTIGYYLPFGYKAQYVDVNGERLGAVAFDGPTEQWLERAFKAYLSSGSNVIGFEKYWGWMYFDYVAVSGEAVNVGQEVSTAAPATFALHANYPNPFRNATVVRYSVPRDTRVRLELFDVTGRSVLVLTDGPAPAGMHRARLMAGSLPNGVYLLRMQAEGFTETQTLTIVK